jgi:hypothetical protein
LCREMNVLLPILNFLIGAVSWCSIGRFIAKRRLAAWWKECLRDMSEGRARAEVQYRFILVTGIWPLYLAGLIGRAFIRRSLLQVVEDANPKVVVRKAKERERYIAKLEAEVESLRE